MVLAWLDAQQRAAFDGRHRSAHNLETARRPRSRAKRSALRPSRHRPMARLMHYRVDRRTPINVLPKDGHLSGLDSGGQIWMAKHNKNIPATIAIGHAAADTCAPNGLIAMSRCCWPKGWLAAIFEAVGRLPLWMGQGRHFDSWAWGHWRSGSHTERPRTTARSATLG